MTHRVQTRSGLMVPLDRPEPHHIRLGDIAAGLSRIQRFNGATLQPWSVADHSLLVLGLMPADAAPELRLAALLHDAHEAYIGDIVSPVAAMIRGTRDACPIEGLKVGFDAAITRAIGLPDGAFLKTAIGDADRQALAVECHLLLAPPDRPWPDLASLPEPLPEIGWRTPGAAYADFLRACLGLIHERHAIHPYAGPPAVRDAYEALP